MLTDVNTRDSRVSSEISRDADYSAEVRWGRLLREARKARGWSGADLGRRLGYGSSPSMIYEWETGHSRITRANVDRIRKVLPELPEPEAAVLYAAEDPKSRAATPLDSVQPSVDTEPSSSREGNPSTAAEGEAPAMPDDRYFLSVRGNWPSLSEEQRERVMRFVAGLVAGAETPEGPQTRRGRNTSPRRRPA